MANSAYRLLRRLRARNLSKFGVVLSISRPRLAPKDKGLKSACLFSLGDTYRMVGEFAKAGKCYTQAHRLSLGENDGLRALDALVGLGLSLRATGDHKKALAIFDGCLRGFRRHKDRAGTAFTLWARSGALRLKGDIKGAVKGFKEAKKIFSRLRDRSGVGYCLTGLGGASRVLGKPADSYGYHLEANRAQGRQRHLRRRLFVLRHRQFLRMRGITKARRILQKAKMYGRIGDKVSYAYTLWGEGALQMLGRHASAMADFEEAKTLCDQDKRGLVYRLLSEGQSVFKDDRKGPRMINDALKGSVALKVEARYAKEVLNDKEGPGECLFVCIAGLNYPALT